MKFRGLRTWKSRLDVDSSLICEVTKWLRRRPLERAFFRDTTVAIARVSTLFRPGTSDEMMIVGNKNSELPFLDLHLFLLTIRHFR